MEAYTSLSIGTELVSPERTYTVVDVLGQGGFGITYLVETSVQLNNISTTVKLAVKEHFLKDLCNRDTDAGTVSCFTHNTQRVYNSRKAFVAEANRIKSVCRMHPNIVSVNEVFDANGTSYYVMEYVEGVSLREYIKEHGTATVNEAIMLMRPIVEAVALLHRKQINHLDINPNNVMVGSNPRRRTILIDFGLAKHFDDSGNATSSLLLSGYSAGYAPVEQYGGITTFSPTADVYSLGATLFYCLTGVKPLPATEITQEWIQSQLPDAVPGVVRTTILKAMASKKTDRYQDASELARDMDNWIDEFVVVDEDDMVDDRADGEEAADITEIVDNRDEGQANPGEATVFEPVDNKDDLTIIEAGDTGVAKDSSDRVATDKEPIPALLKKRLLAVSLLAGLAIWMLPVFTEHGQGIKVFDAIDALNDRGNPLGVILCMVLPFITAAFIRFKAMRKSLPILLGMMATPILIYGLTFPDGYSVNVGFGFVLDMLLTGLFAFWVIKELKK